MILLDTDHATALKYRQSDRFKKLNRRLQSVPNEIIGTTIVTIEEQMRGWLAVLAKERLVKRQVSAYRDLQGLFDFFATFMIVPFDDHAALGFVKLSAMKLRIATMDLKIASIALATDSLLLTANRRDFEKVPGLKFENWID